MSVLIGSTIPAFKMTEAGHWWHWLDNYWKITEQAKDAGHTVDWLAVIQVDGRGDEPFTPLLDLLDHLDRLDADVWRFSIDRGEDRITGRNRLGAICIGRNLIIERALNGGHDWIYFADADISAPDDLLPRLLELDWPVCGAHVPIYGLDGPPAAASDSEAIRHAGRNGDVRVHWTTAGSLLVGREVFRRVPWRWDLDRGLTDDPATQDEMARLGWPTLVRHDVICTHHPDEIGAIESRGFDLAVH